jgi:ABC-type transporter Mla MlaB component
MIRITCKNETSATRLLLEGKLAGHCVDELDKCWQRSSASPTTLLVDLTSISFIDDQGKELLTKMLRHGAQLVSRSLMTKCLIKEIKQAVRKN